MINITARGFELKQGTKDGIEKELKRIEKMLPESAEYEQCDQTKMFLFSLRHIFSSHIFSYRFFSISIEACPPKPSCSFLLKCILQNLQVLFHQTRISLSGIKLLSRNVMTGVKCLHLYFMIPCRCRFCHGICHLITGKLNL